MTPERRGEGIGRKILQMVLEYGGRAEGLEQILLSVTTTQASAQALYCALGFVSFGREPRALKIGEQFVDEEYMVLHLKASDSH